MPVITKIEQQRKRKDRYSVFVDGKYSFALSDVDLVTANIRKGQELGDDEVRSLIDLSGSSKLYDQAVHYLSFRPRSVEETRDHLLGKGYDSSEVEPVIQKLIDQKFLDDAAFTASWIESRALLKPSSKRKLTLELRGKGIAANIIESALEQLDPSSEIEAIKAVAQKKLALKRFQDQRKLTEYLIRQGFAYDQVKAALSELEI